MEERREKYINPFTDYGRSPVRFKRLFGEEPNKDLLLDFLNELLKHEQGKITELTYLKSDKLGSTLAHVLTVMAQRKCVFPIASVMTTEPGKTYYIAFISLENLSSSVGEEETVGLNTLQSDIKQKNLKGLKSYFVEQSSRKFHGCSTIHLQRQ